MKKTAVALIILVILFICFSYYSFLKSPVNISEDTLFQVKKGDSVTSIINNLVERGVIKNRLFFKVMVKTKGGDRAILHGYYMLKTGDTPESIWDRFSKGEVERYKITIPEGYNIYQIGEVIKNQKMGSKQRFVNLAKDKKFIKDLGLNLTTLEGYLFPATYFFDPDTKEEDMIREMVTKTFDVLYKELKIPANDRNYDIHKILTLASLVEKEAKVKEELPLIAAVFKNRLKLGMKLQCDPTVIYGTKRFNSSITKADLAAKNPYNTYVNYGLPPTPIANPSKEAVLSVLNPAKVDYIYFVSKNDGTHIFTNNLKAHNKAVYIYQKKKKKKGDA
ncbi:MAG: endolytic transglycosylase MltG [bacterium]